MTQTNLGGNPVQTSGDLPGVGNPAPAFELVGPDLSTIRSAELAGERVVLNVFPSIDTPTCAASVRRFNDEAAQFDNTRVLCVSADLPFAASRFCASEGLDRVSTGSTFRGSTFGDDYGLRLVDGALEGLLARAVVVVDGDGTVLHSQLVPEIADEPDYDAAITSLS